MRHSTVRLVKTKALISCAVTAQLICGFVFAYAKIQFSHNEAQLISLLTILRHLNVICLSSLFYWMCGHLDGKELVFLLFVWCIVFVMFCVVLSFPPDAWVGVLYLIVQCLLL